MLCIQNENSGEKKNITNETLINFKTSKCFWRAEKLRESGKKIMEHTAPTKSLKITLSCYSSY